jgi:hypothetical protein
MVLCISFCQLKRKLMGNMGAVKAAVAFGGFRSGATFQHNAAGISESAVVPSEVTRHHESISWLPFFFRTDTERVRVRVWLSRDDCSSTSR